MSTMRADAMWSIREARGLKAAEKAILWAVESRGIAYGTAETVMTDAGLSHGAFYRWRDALQQKGLLIVTERNGTTTEYRVDAEAVSLLGEGSPKNGRGVSQKEQGGLPKSVVEVDLQEHPQENHQGNHSSLSNGEKKLDVWEQAAALKATGVAPSL